MALIDGLVQKRRNSSALVRLSCTNPSKFTWEKLVAISSDNGFDIIRHQ